MIEPTINDIKRQIEETEIPNIIIDCHLCDWSTVGRQDKATNNWHLHLDMHTEEDLAQEKTPYCGDCLTALSVCGCKP